MKTKNGVKRGLIKKVSKYVGIAILFLAFIFIAIVALKIGILVVFYNWAHEYVYNSFGLDFMLSRVVAVGSAALFLIALPSIFSFLIFGKSKRMVLAVVLIAISSFIGLTYFGSRDIFFSRDEGNVKGYVMKTMNGFEFSSKPDIHPIWNKKFEPITPELAKEYFLWKKTGSISTIPPVDHDKFFDYFTGEAITWYLKTSQNSYKLFSLPGYDPITGVKLTPMDEATAKLITSDSYHYDRKNEIYVSGPEEVSFKEETFKEEIYEDEVYKEVDIDSEIFSMSKYWKLGEKLIYSDQRVGVNCWVEASRIFFFEDFTVIGCKITNHPTSWKSNCYFHGLPVQLFDTAHGVAFDPVKRFFADKRRGDICNEDLCDQIIVYHDDPRYILFVFPCFPKEVFLNGRFQLVWGEDEYLQIRMEKYEKKICSPTTFVTAPVP